MNKTNEEKVVKGLAAAFNTSVLSLPDILCDWLLTNAHRLILYIWYEDFTLSNKQVGASLCKWALAQVVTTELPALYLEHPVWLEELQLTSDHWQDDLGEVLLDLLSQEQQDLLISQAIFSRPMGVASPSDRQHKPLRHIGSIEKKMTEAKEAIDSTVRHIAYALDWTDHKEKADNSIDHAKMCLRGRNTNTVSLTRVFDVGERLESQRLTARLSLDKTKTKLTSPSSMRKSWQYRWRKK